MNRENKGVKLDSAKLDLALLFLQFPNILAEVVKCSEYGHEKYKETDYDYLNYQRLDNAEWRYKNAGLRHMVQQMSGEEIDSESGLKHIAHKVWNTLAEGEMNLKEKNKKSKYDCKINFEKQLEIFELDNNENNNTYSFSSYPINFSNGFFDKEKKSKIVLSKWNVYNPNKELECVIEANTLSEVKESIKENFENYKDYTIIKQWKKN